MHHKNEVTKIIQSALVGSNRRIDIQKIHKLMDDYADNQKSLPSQKIKLEIGSKAMSELTSENILHIVLIEGCCPSVEYWNEPELLDFSNKMFSDTIVIEFVSYRKNDSKRSCEYTFFFNFKDFRFHYVKDFDRDNQNRQSNSKRIQLSTLRYLIEQGFNVPIY